MAGRGGALALRAAVRAAEPCARAAALILPGEAGRKWLREEAVEGPEALAAMLPPLLLLMVVLAWLEKVPAEEGRLRPWGEAGTDLEGEGSALLPALGTPDAPLRPPIAANTVKEAAKWASSPHAASTLPL